ncbi:MAG: M15 family metallopeptidase [Candidatus Hydrogenedentes bacterium]|nr:M15 family metallopeptidase [Candidatus Hydrogenedentota bacterium]
MKPETYRDARDRYGDVNLVNATWPGEARWMVLFDVPHEIAAIWINESTGRGMPTRRIYCNQDLVAPLHRALENLRCAGLLSELKTFDGCFEIRSVRGSYDKVSAHAYGLAIDLNATDNPTGATPKLTPQFVGCWEDAGFDWGGRFSRPNGMHFSYAWEGTGNPMFARAAMRLA